MLDNTEGDIKKATNQSMPYPVTEDRMFSVKVKNNSRVSHP